MMAKSNTIRQHKSAGSLSCARFDVSGRFMTAENKGLSSGNNEIGNAVIMKSATKKESPIDARMIGGTLRWVPCFSSIWSIAPSDLLASSISLPFA